MRVPQELDGLTMGNPSMDSMDDELGVHLFMETPKWGKASHKTWEQLGFKQTPSFFRTFKVQEKVVPTKAPATYKDFDGCYLGSSGKV